METKENQYTHGDGDHWTFRTRGAIYTSVRCTSSPLFRRRGLKLGMFFKQLNGGNIFLAASAPRVREGVLGVKANVYAAARTRKKEIEKTHTHTHVAHPLWSLWQVFCT